ncbi:MBOAT family O-acyltransferase [Emergencia sp.]|uniref:MBOAT family O-acyltransferase n=1 Tax=Emergencia sp. TaxID=1926557 RepID=UPI003AEF79B7
MLFSSIVFLFYFLPIVLLAYFVVPKKAKNIVLLIASIFFYSWGEPVYVFLMIFSAIFNYFMAIDIGRAKVHQKSGKSTLVFTVIVNLFVLSFFKYYGFLMDTVNGILGTDIKYTALALPIGISFYTFQALSYIFDVYRGNVKVQVNPLKFTLYLALFPQLIAGPIVKYKDIAEQLDERHVTLEKFGDGTMRFLLGLGKKVILANNLGAIYTQIMAVSDSQVSVLTYWIGIIAYTLQIYFDFSGYSDMAIGLGKMFGFEFMENFNYPYISKTITEFWRRWHMSLSTWFREYVYIPLGGNRVSMHRHIINLLIVWSLTGLWHGASWNFVVWGLYYGLLLILEKYLIGKYIEKAPAWAQHLYAMIIVMIGWVFFSSVDLTAAIDYLKILFCMGGVPLANTYTLYLLRTNLLLLAIGCIAASPEPMKQFNILCKKSAVIAIIMILLVLVLATAYLIFSSYNPFLYFRF